LEETVEANFLANRDEVREFRREMTALEGRQSERLQDRFNTVESRFDSLSSSSVSLKGEFDARIDAAVAKQRADHLAHKNVSRWRVITLSVSITSIALPALWSAICIIKWRSIFP
jgi:predicted nuclease with TOPRIM domain